MTKFIRTCTPSARTLASSHSASDQNPPLHLRFVFVHLCVVSLYFRQKLDKSFSGQNTSFVFLNPFFYGNETDTTHFPVVTNTGTLLAKGQKTNNVQCTAFSFGWRRLVNGFIFRNNHRSQQFERASKHVHETTSQTLSLCLECARIHQKRNCVCNSNREQHIN